MGRLIEALWAKDFIVQFLCGDENCVEVYNPVKDEWESAIVDDKNKLPDVLADAAYKALFKEM